MFNLPQWRHTTVHEHVEDVRLLHLRHYVHVVFVPHDGIALRGANLWINTHTAVNTRALGLVPRILPLYFHDWESEDEPPASSGVGGSSPG